MSDRIDRLAGAIANVEFVCRLIADERQGRARVRCTDPIPGPGEINGRTIVTYCRRPPREEGKPWNVHGWAPNKDIDERSFATELDAVETVFAATKGEALVMLAEERDRLRKMDALIEAALRELESE